MRKTGLAVFIALVALCGLCEAAKVRLYSIYPYFDIYISLFRAAVQPARNQDTESYPRKSSPSLPCAAPTPPVLLHSRCPSHADAHIIAATTVDIRRQR